MPVGVCLLFVCALCSDCVIFWYFICVLFVFSEKMSAVGDRDTFKTKQMTAVFQRCLCLCVCLCVCGCFFSGIQDSTFVTEEKLIYSPIVRAILKWNSHSTHHALVTIHILGSFLKKSSLSVQHQVVQRVPNVLSRLLVFSQTLRSKPWSVDDPFYLGVSNYMGNERKNMLKKKKKVSKDFK